MCGIVGYVGHRPAQDLLLAGLRKLEYRGYDSAGMSLLADGEIHSVRAVGNLDRLEAALAGESATATATSCSRSRQRTCAPAAVSRAAASSSP